MGLLLRALPDRIAVAVDEAVADAWRALWISRLLVWSAAIAAVVLFGLSGRQDDFDPAGLTTPYGATGDALAAPLARWDSVWFMAIASDGYGDGAREAFFPLYPLLVRIVSAPPFGSRRCRRARSRRRRCSPSRSSCCTGSSRSITSAPSPATRSSSPRSFRCRSSSRPSTASRCSSRCPSAPSTPRGASAGRGRARWALLAATTRSAGVLLLVPLAMIYLWDADRPSLRTMRPLRPDALWLALVPLGLAAYCAVLALGGHDPLAPFDAQEVWFRSFAGPFVGAWDGLVAAVQGARQLLSGAREPVYFTAAGGDPFVVARHNIELFVWLALALVALAGVLRRLPAAYGAYVVAALALPLSYPVGPQPLMSLPRFVAVLFPLAIWLALWMTGRVVRERLVVAALRCRRSPSTPASSRRGIGSRSASSRSMRSARSSSSSVRRHAWWPSCAPAACGSASRRPPPRCARRSRYYRVHHDSGADAASLALLRDRCAEVLRGALSARARDVDALAPDELRDALLASLRFARSTRCPPRSPSCARPAIASSSSPTGTSRCTRCCG